MTEPPPVRASYRTDLVTSLLGVWFTVGLMLDAWAHNNVPGLETFFTVWHAVFYSGFAASAAWIAWAARAGLRDGRWAPQLMPREYPAAVLALAGFAVAGVGDFAWHQAFGIEQSINILFSPTHLGLITAMMVIITTPLRTFRSQPMAPASASLARALPAVLSAALATTLVLLFLQYANVLLYSPAGVVHNLSGAGLESTARFVTSLAVTNLVVIVPLLLLAGRGRLPVGSATVLYGVVAGLAAAITGLDHAALTGLLLLIGVAVDILALAIRPGPLSPRRYRLFGLLAPILTWALYLAGARALAHGVVVPVPGVRPESGVELWTGAPIVQGLLGLLVAMLLGGGRLDRPGPAEVPAASAAIPLGQRAAR